jgi:ParB family transcriptional regulator, chromosome partitioning protein
MFVGGEPMKTLDIPCIPISEIHIANPRPRNQWVFDQIVSSIAAVGLKTPITVSKRGMAADGTQYDLVCGQGRLEAFLALAEEMIPAIIIEASREDRYLMSLIENVARRPPSRNGLLKETKSLRDRGYSVDEIASKLGFGRSYIGTIVVLLDHGEAELIHLVENSKIPLTVATEIANGNSKDIQRALTEAYDSGDLRGSKLRAARKMIRRRLIGNPKAGTQRAAVTSKALAKEFQEQTRAQRSLVKRAAVVRERLELASAACREIFGDPNFITLLRAEGLTLMSEKLVEMTRAEDHATIS